MTTADLAAARAALDDALSEAFRADILAFAAAAPGRIYALVDQAQCNAEHLTALIDDHRLAEINLFAGTPEAHSPEYGPLLLELPRPLSPALAETLARDAALPLALSLIASPLKADDLAAHLRVCLNAGMADGASFLVRYYDPRTGFDACRAWPEAARRQFLAPLAAWFGWDRDAQPQTLHPQGKPAPGEAPAWPLAITDELLAALNPLNEIDFIIDQAFTDAKTGAVSNESEISPWLAYTIVREALAFTAGHKNVAWDDALAAGKCALRDHPHFYRDERFTRRLAALTPEPGRIARLLESLLSEGDFFRLNERNAALAALYARLTQRSPIRTAHPGEKA